MARRRSAHCASAGLTFPANLVLVGLQRLTCSKYDLAAGHSLALAGPKAALPVADPAR